MTSNLYLNWLASARFCDDLGKEVNDHTLKNVKGLIFKDEAFIEFREGTFGCITGIEEIESAFLFEVVDFLWYTHSSHN